MKNLTDLKKKKNRKQNQTKTLTKKTDNQKNPTAQIFENTCVRLPLPNCPVHGLWSAFFILELLDFVNLSHIPSDVYTEFWVCNIYIWT